MIEGPIEDRVSIVVLNWNSGELGSAATRSAVEQAWPDVEVIVVDNASTDDSLERIRNDHPDVSVIVNDENLGFAGGMNTGIAVATGGYVIPLNCDAELDTDYSRRLVEVLRTDPRAAAAGGRVESPRVGSSGPLRITSVMRTEGLPVDEPGYCDKLNGACPMFRAAALADVVRRFGGPYDASYFTYGEDIDLAHTLRRLGWRFRYEPSATASHVRSYGSAPRIADRRGPLRISTLTNRHRNIVRHGRRPWWVVSTVAMVQDAGFAVLRAVRGDLRAALDVVTAWRRVVTTLGEDRARRRLLADPTWVETMADAAEPALAR